MSTAPALGRIVLLLDGRRDPRRHRRYPISLDLTYKLFHQNGRVARFGSGRTLDISSGGACFESMDTFPQSAILELSINWPCVLEGICPLRLVMRGHIVRTGDRRVAIEAEHSEFRTTGTRRMHTHPPSSKRRAWLG